MSPLWRDEVIIGLAPGRLELVRRRRGLRPAIKASRVIDVECTAQDGWAPAVAALSNAITAPQWQKARCRIVVSNHFVRYALMNAPAALDGDDERAAFVDHRFKVIHGVLADTWQTTYSDFRGTQSAVGCAVDRAMIDALKASLATARLVPVSLQPYLMSALNAAADALRGTNVWFVAVESGRIALASFTNDRWAGVRNEPLKGDAGPAVAAMLAQDAMAHDLTEGANNAYIHAPGWTGEPVSPGPGWTVERLQPSTAAATTRTPGTPDLADLPLAMSLGFAA